METLADVLGSKSRAEVLKALFLRPGVEVYLRELHRQSGLSIRPIQQELGKLLEIGLVKVRKDGNRSYYSANTTHPLFPEISRLVEKTSGAQALLASALSDPEIKLAFIFGSVAAGTARPESDLDLFVIGDLGLRKLTRLLSGMTERLGRVVNPHVMSVVEFVKKRDERDHFISSVMASPRILVVGNEDELKRLGKKRLGQSA